MGTSDTVAELAISLADEGKHISSSGVVALLDGAFNSGDRA